MLDLSRRFYKPDVHASLFVCKSRWIKYHLTTTYWHDDDVLQEVELWKASRVQFSKMHTITHWHCR
jgi:hypothetical protein